MNNFSYSNYLLAFITSINKGDLSSAAAIDSQHYTKFVKPTENVLAWDNWQKDTLSARLELTKISRCELPDRPPCGDADTFLIVHHNYSGLAHEQQIARNLIHLRCQGLPVKFKVIYLFGAPNQDHLSKAEMLYGIPQKDFLFLDSSDYVNAGRRLDDYVDKRKDISTVIYVTIYFMAFWVSLFVRHSNQKFIQMKYPPFQAGRIAEWGTGRSNYDRFILQNSECWTQLGILDLRPFGDLAQTTLQVRNSDLISFGSISRIEKILNPDYLNFIERILDDNKQLIYLYTARDSEVRMLPQKFIEHPRVRNLGWVKPEEAIIKFDIYLDSFPWGGGDMSLLALSSGIPYLTLSTPENKRFGIFRFLTHLGKDNEVISKSFPISLANLGETLLSLAKEPILRQSLANEWRLVLNAYSTIEDCKAWNIFLTK